METKISNDCTAVIYRKTESGIEFLVLKRFDPEKNQEFIRLVKGGVKKEETAENTILREISEEVGMSESKIVAKLKNYEYESEYKGINVIHKVQSFLVEIPAENSSIKIDSSEEGGFTINGAEWVTNNQAAETLSFEVERELAREAILAI